MGLFSDAFDVGAGATLGSMASANLVNMSGRLVSNTITKAYNEYRSSCFDPIVREDICNIMVKGNLPQMAYPFPSVNGSLGEKENFFKQHKIFTAILAVFIISVISSGVTASGNGSESLAVMMGFSLLALFFAGIGMMIMKIGKIGKKAVVNTSYKNQLGNDGQQYWYVREYIRQALETHQLTAKEAVYQMCNTRLAQQLPDTAEELDAHIFYYKQRLGLN